LETQEQMYTHIVKLLDKEDRHTLFDLLFRVVKGDRKQTAKIMGRTLSNVDEALDERRKSPYDPKPETAARIFAYLLEADAMMSNSANEDVLESVRYHPENRLNKEVLDAVKRYKSTKAKEDPAFKVAWGKITKKLKSEQEIINKSLRDMDLPESQRSDPDQEKREKGLQEIVLEIEQLKAVTDKVKKVCGKKGIPQPGLKVLEFIAKFPEDNWLFLWDKATRRNMSVEQMKGMCPIWGIYPK
jgi:hypothetical protein